MAPRTTVLQIRLSDAEKRLIQESARRADMPMSAWLRLVILNANLRALTPEAKPRKKRRQEAK